MKKQNIKDRISIATICNQWEEIVREYNVSFEMDIYCQASNMDQPQAAEAAAEADRMQQLGRCAVFHAPFNELYPAAIDPLARQLAMDRLNAAARISMDRGIYKMVVHSGYVPFIFFKDYHVDCSIEFWTEFMADKPDDFHIAIENVLDDEPDMILRTVKGVNDPRVRMCLDVGHVAVFGSTPAEEWVKETAPWLSHLHIHNNDGSWDLHDPIHVGMIDMEQILDTVITDCPADTTITLETIDGLSSMAWLKDKEYIS